MGSSHCSWAGPARALLFPEPSAQLCFSQIPIIPLFPPNAPRCRKQIRSPGEGAGPSTGPCCQQGCSHHLWERGGDRSRHSHRQPKGHRAWAVNPSHNTVCIAQSRVQSPGYGTRVGVFFYFFSTGRIRTIPPGRRLTIQSSHHLPGAQNTLWASPTATGEELQGIPRLPLHG